MDIFVIMLSQQLCAMLKSKMSLCRGKNPWFKPPLFWPARLWFTMSIAQLASLRGSKPNDLTGHP